jgi:hypothetical protein
MSSNKIAKATTLIIGDNELNCNCKDLKIEDLNITHIGLNLSILKQFDLILYSGEKGTKLIKSRYTKTGIIN